MEIERKWLIEKLPDLDIEDSCTVVQGYLNYEPNEVRIRCKVRGEDKSDCKLTIKSGDGLCREEVETKITYEEFQAFAALCVSDFAVKEYYTYYFNDRLLECSIVDDSWAYAEVEFENEDAAALFIAPTGWQEVTGLSEYKMAEYCKNKTLDNEWKEYMYGTYHCGLKYWGPGESEEDGCIER